MPQFSTIEYIVQVNLHLLCSVYRHCTVQTDILATTPLAHRQMLVKIHVVILRDDAISEFK